MSHLSTRHDNKDHGVLNSDLILSLVARESPTECKIHNHELYRIGNLADVSHIRKLDIAFNSLTNIDGLDQLPALRELSCYSCRLEDVEGIRGMNKLEYLYFQQNQIEELPDLFQNMHKLKELRFDRNGLTKLYHHLNGCNALRKLDLGYNRIDDISGVSGLQCLRELSLTHNHIKSLKALRALPSLRELDVSYNQLKSLEGLEFLPTLQTLRADHNSLTSLKIPMTYTYQQSQNKALLGDEDNDESNTTGGTESNSRSGSRSALSSRNSNKSNKSGSSHTSAREEAKNRAANRGNSSSNNNGDKTKRKKSIVGLGQLTEVFLSSNKLKSLSGLETLGPNIEKLDLTGNRITVSSMLDESTLNKDVPARKEVAGVKAGSGLFLLLQLSHLYEVRFYNNPVHDDSEVMTNMNSVLRKQCPRLSAIDDQAFLSREQEELGLRIDDDGSLVPDDHSIFNTWKGINGGTNDKNNTDDVSTLGPIEDDRHEHSDSSDEEEEDEEEDGEVALDMHGKPRLAAKVSLKNIKTMEQIEEYEGRMRTLFSDSKSILNSIFLLEDTVDGLFNSVDPDLAEQLPQNDQFKKILSISQPVEERFPRGDSSSIMQKKHSGLIADENLRNSNRNSSVVIAVDRSDDILKAALAARNDTVSPASPAKSPTGTEITMKSQYDGDIHVQTALGITIVNADSGSPMEGTEAPTTTFISDKEQESSVRGSMMAQEGQEDDFWSAIGKPAAISNKDYVKQLVREIKHKVETESILSPNKNLTASGIVGKTNRSIHDEDLPLGSGYTRYGTKIVSNKSKTETSTTSLKKSSVDSIVGSSSPSEAVRLNSPLSPLDKMTTDLQQSKSDDPETTSAHSSNHASPEDASKSMYNHKGGHSHPRNNNNSVTVATNDHHLALEGMRKLLKNHGQPASNDELWRQDQSDRLFGYDTVVDPPADMQPTASLSSLAYKPDSASGDKRMMHTKHYDQRVKTPTGAQLSLQKEGGSNVDDEEGVVSPRSSSMAAFSVHAARATGGMAFDPRRSRPLSARSKGQQSEGEASFDDGAETLSDGGMNSRSSKREDLLSPYRSPRHKGYGEEGESLGERRFSEPSLKNSMKKLMQEHQKKLLQGSSKVSLN